MLLAGIHREFPHAAPAFLDANDFRPTRQRTPVFYGCYDWHSAVHSHWALLRLLRWPGAEGIARIGAALERSFGAEALAEEARFLGRPERSGFEMPYGLAWLLTLCAEARRLDQRSAGAAGSVRTLANLGERLAPLEAIAVSRFMAWLPRLTHPCRSGQHGQTAFSLALVWDYARARNHTELSDLVARRARDFYAADVAAPLGYEPSAHDFLSPSLAEADLMGRVLDPSEFVGWLEGFLPAVAQRPVTPVDRQDGKLVHFDGLNFSRAWMLRGIARNLPFEDPRRAEWGQLAEEHAAAGMAGLSEAGYAGSHWLGSFAVYWLTVRSSSSKD